MSLRLRLEAKAADGRLLCDNCGSVPAGAATYSVTVDNWNAQRYELISETCNGVRSTVPQFQCLNGPLEISVRVRTGEVDLRIAYLPGTSTSSYGSWVNGPRLTFAEDPTKYWDLVLPDGIVPAGKYKITNGNQTGVLPRDGGIVGCNKTHVNSDDVLDVPAGGSVIHTMVFRIDDCPVRLEVDVSYLAAGQTYEIQGAAFTCRRAFTSIDHCDGWVQHGTNLTLTANVPAGFQPRFRGAIGCPSTTQAACNIKVERREVAKMSIVPVVGPPPPTPSLSVSLGDVPPPNRSEAKGSSNLPWLHAKLTPADGTVEVTSLTLQASGTGRDDLDLTELRVHLDSNANGRLDDGEALLGKGKYSNDNGSVAITLTTPLAVAAPMQLLVVGDIASSVNTAFVVGFGSTALAMLGLLAWPRKPKPTASDGPTEPTPEEGHLLRTQRQKRLALATLGMLMLAACGGGSNEPASPVAPSPVAPSPVAPSPVAPSPVAPSPGSPPPAPPPPPVTYEMRLTAMQARVASNPATVVSPSGLPVQGATISVQP